MADEKKTKKTDEAAAEEKPKRTRKKKDEQPAAEEKPKRTRAKKEAVA